MIVDLFFAFCKVVIDLILGPITAVSLPWDTSMTVPSGAWSPFGNGLLGAVFPFGHAVSAIGVLVAWSVVCHAYRIVLWFLGVIHVSGTDS